MKKLLFTFLAVFCSITLNAQVRNPMALGGNWEGSWLNNEYQSTGVVTTQITVDEIAGTFTMAINSGGAILGEARDAFEVVCNFDAAGWVADFNSPIWGDVDITGTWDGAFNGVAANPPGGGATNMVTAGTISPTEFNRTFSFNWWGQAVDGTEILEKLNVILSPTNVGGTETNSVTVTWEDNSDNETGFKLDRKVGTDGTWEEIADLAAGTTEYLDESVEHETEYFYRVAGYNGDTESEYSEEFSITTSPATDIVDNTNIPVDYLLLQNYPNPFNPTTNIEFNLPRESHVKLVVYSFIGEEVATLLDGYRNSGRYQVTFSSADLPSGVYLLKMSATSALSGNQFVDIKKMVILK